MSVRFCRLGRGSAGVSGVGRKLSLRARGDGCRGLGDGVVSGCGVVGSGLLLEPADGVVEFSEGKGGSGGNGLYVLLRSVIGEGGLLIHGVGVRLLFDEGGRGGRGGDLGSSGGAGGCCGMWSSGGVSL